MREKRERRREELVFILVNARIALVEQAKFIDSSVFGNNVQYTFFELIFYTLNNAHLT